jgi:hypothetical protein
MEPWSPLRLEVSTALSIPNIVQLFVRGKITVIPDADTAIKSIVTRVQQLTGQEVLQCFFLSGKPPCHLLVRVVNLIFGVVVE